MSRDPRLCPLHPDWQISPDGKALTRAFTFKGMAKAAQLANLAAWHGDRLGHHPDISFGWGYTRISYTTHDAGGLTTADFCAAAGLDSLLTPAPAANRRI